MAKTQFGFTSTTPTRPGLAAQATPESWIMAPKRRRSRTMLALGLGLTAACGVAAAWLAAAAGHQVEVLAAARPIAYGKVISDADLTVAHSTRDTSLNPLRADQRDRVVGRVAAVDLRRGQLVTLDSVTDSVSPGSGEQLVGVAMKTTQLPWQPLHPKDRVLFVETAPDGEATASDAQPATIAATVLDIGAPNPDGTVVVDVVVPTTDGPKLSTWVAAGRVALVVQARTR